MVENPKILKLDHRVWWVIFIVLYVFLIAVMVGTLSTRVWVELKPENLDVFKFKGSLIRVTDGLGEIPNIANPLSPLDVEGQTYQKIYGGACFVKDVLDKETTQVFTWNLYHSWCKMFKNLWMGAGVFIVFEITAIICIVIIIALLVLFIFKKFYFITSFLATGCMWASHIIGIIAWITISQGQFNDDCSNLTDGEKAPKICAKDGPKLGLFVLLFIPFIVIPFFCVTCLLRGRIIQEVRLETKVDTNKDEDVNNVTQMKDHKNFEPKL
ncbi:hypothetical protein SteCoe_9459 [Stentor coeruleus]|uniref:Uncharacterized protein n=1 Tax=Stentor coeruleus TaxID=5963 RepID=A0A1R2CHS1_9CILI|nr:hypothetical protein SteCoe_9459 [Stentor coeruleus]